ncbi:alkylhydroperoxidase [Rhodobacteraceae bacterium WD3A24]|nr:alkylhydroperoxidase [Rhodobacteraceae bacterium WD3A24]
MTNYTMTLPPVDETNAEGAAKSLLDQAQAAVGMVPNMYRSMANSPGVLETYMTGYGLFRESGQFTPPEQETVFLTVSRENGCDYCMAAHTMIARNKSGVSQEDTDALRAGTALPDPKLDALSRFTAHMVQTRGRPEPEKVEAFKAAGYSDRHVLEIILAIAVKTLSNYSNHIARHEVDPAFAEYKV